MKENKERSGDQVSMSRLGSNFSQDGDRGPTSLRAQLPTEEGYGGVCSFLVQLLLWLKKTPAKNKPICFRYEKRFV